MPARLAFSRSLSSGWSSVEADASSVSTSVMLLEYGAAAATLAWALAIREVAIISIALVVFWVDLTVRTRCRSTRT